MAKQKRGGVVLETVTIAIYCEDMKQAAFIKALLNMIVNKEQRTQSQVGWNLIVNYFTPEEVQKIADVMGYQLVEESYY